MFENQSKREFIINGSKILATFVGVVTFSKFLSFSQSTKENGIIPTSLSHIIENKNNILVAYESKFGSTAEVAKFIGANLSVDKSKIDIKKINEINNLSSYSQIIIGSAIQYDKWMPEAREFIIKNESELSTKSVSFFLVCLVLSKKNEKANLKATSYVNKIKDLVPKIKVGSFGKFAGVLDYSKMSFGQRILAKGIFAIIGVKEGDYRDWNSIKKWSEKIEF